ncbi:hypothetical protein N184_09895 [Sinorhizobium sp. GL28]|nr:hypothetical protein N184_09895 [Sinorhizobium sp. GL28]
MGVGYFHSGRDVALKAAEVKTCNAVRYLRGAMVAAAPRRTGCFHPWIGDDLEKQAAGDSAFIFCIIAMTVAVGATLFRRISVPRPL